MILILDNYDSFTWNLAQYFGELGAEVQVVRSDTLSVEEIRARRPSHLVISPGPGTPDEAGVSLAAIAQLGTQLPILGVCLGHQAIGQAFGGRIVRAPRIMHGKTSPVSHDGSGLFRGLPSPLIATRYHSLVIDPPSLPDCLVANAHIDGEGDEIMGVRHHELLIHGVQFHPESILTVEGKRLLQNFLSL